MATIPTGDGISELGALMKTRHPGRSDPFGIKARKGLRQSYEVHGRRPLVRHPRKPHRAR